MRRLLLLALLVTFVAGCRRKPSREWNASDHDEEPSSGGAQVPGVAGSAAATAGDDALADTTWRTTCAVCHGMIGRGDGPNGPMVKAPDLTDKAFLGQRTDAQLAMVIRQGKGKMPPFPQLPNGVVNALVRRIREAGAM